MPNMLAAVVLWLEETMLRELIKRREGSVAINFGLIVVPLILFAGLAIDYTRARQTQSQLNTAADATAIAAATAASDGASNQDIQTIAKGYFKSNYADPLASVQVTASNAKVTVVAQKSISTTLLRLAGIEKFDLSARSVAAKSNPADAEIALVLDYSGSMKTNDKYIAMRNAAIDMINQLASASATNANMAQVKIGLVPFSEFVYGDMKSTYIRDIHMDKHGATVRACLDFPAPSLCYGGFDTEPGHRRHQVACTGHARRVAAFGHVAQHGGEYARHR